MIAFQFELLEGDDRIPKEVAEWLTAYNQRYPRVTFALRQLATHPDLIETQEALVTKFSQTFGQGNYSFIGQTSFLYRKESWNIRFIGPPEEVGAMTFPVERYELLREQPKTYGVPRTPANPATDYPTEFVILHPDPEEDA